ncbi:MAG: triple tyrosine motif-containing protein [bacterium]
MMVLRFRRARIWALACLAWLGGATAYSQGPEPTLAQLDHRAWTNRDGAPGVITSIVQTTDGYLWLGAMTGLYRFDGVRFERFSEPAHQKLPSESISALLALPDGSLWIGYSKGGVSVLMGEQLTTVDPGTDGLPHGTVNAIARDSSGVSWVATTRGLYQRSSGSWQRIDADPRHPGDPAAYVLVDRRGAVWVAGLTGVYVLARGQQHFVRRAPSLTSGPAFLGCGAIAEAPDGSIWGASMVAGLVPLADSSGAPPAANARGYQDRDWYALLIDRESNAWALGRDGRQLRIPLPALQRNSDGRSEAAQSMQMGRRAGASGSGAWAGFVDREGNVWLGTDGGLDRFRAAKVTAIVFPQPLQYPTLLAESDGRVWAASSNTAAQFEIDGQSVHERHKIPGPVVCAQRGADGVEWFCGVDGLWRVEGDSRTIVTPPSDAKNHIRAIAHGRNRELWASVSFRGVFRRHEGVWRRFDASPEVTGQTALALSGDASGRMWIGYLSNHLVRVDGDSVRVYGAVDGLHIGAVSTVFVRGDNVWVGGDLGVNFLVGDRLRPLLVTSGVMTGVSGIVETANGDLWINGADGATHVPSAEARRARADTAYRARDERFDVRDGVEGATSMMAPNPSVVEGTDGRLWFASSLGVTWMDPQNIRRNLLAPPVHVLALMAGGKAYRGTGHDTLPPGTSGINIAYTALSLGIPERVRFRYRLIGNDDAWQDAGARREAIYTNLGRGSYTFHVIASNDDGVWNNAGAKLEFVILPTFAQTNAFLVACAIAAGCALWLLAAWRQRRIAGALRARFEATLAERTRIARELHDTLLQSFTGVTLQVHAAQTIVHTRPDDASDALVRAVASAQVSLREARHMVWGMRAPELDEGDLADALAAAARDAIGTRPIELQLTVRGARRRLAHSTELTALRIGREAVLNAVRHAAANTVSLILAFEPTRLTLSVRDDGSGFATADVDAARHGGHWGIVGMSERARSAGGSLIISSTLSQGTLITLELLADAPLVDSASKTLAHDSPPDAVIMPPSEVLVHHPNGRRVPHA